jgi:hypothetical protein
MFRKIANLSLMSQILNLIESNKENELMILTASQILQNFTADTK